MAPTAATSASPPSDPLIGFGPFVIDPALSWHVVRMAPRMKDVALRAISLCQAVTFQPCTMEIITRRGRRIDILRPTLARTVFIGVKDPAQLETVRREFEPHSSPPVAEVVCYMTDDTSLKGNIAGQVLKPARLDPVALQGFANNVFKNTKPQPIAIEVGRRVIVTDGPFFSLPAEIEEVMLGRGKVKVSVSMFGAPIPVELDLAQIQLVA